MDPGPVSSLQGKIMSVFLCLPETLIAPKANFICVGPDCIHEGGMVALHLIMLIAVII